MSTFVGVHKAARKREELYLPQLHFPTVDPYLEGNWVDVLGEKTFCAWLKLHTLVDRENGMAKYNNEFTVPRSLQSVMDVFKMSKSTFYRVVIHPLWNYGLIDITEWESDTKKGLKSMNIIVYPYPQNLKALETQPLVKIRNYQKDYKSHGKTFGELGAYVRQSLDLEQYEQDLLAAEEDRFKAQEDVLPQVEPTASNEVNSKGFNNETIDEHTLLNENVDLENGFNNETFKPYPQGSKNKTIDEHSVLNENVDLENGFNNETPMVSKVEPNNNTNTLNTSNTLLKDDEENKYNKNSSVMEENPSNEPTTNDTIKMHRAIRQIIQDDMLLGYTYTHLLQNNVSPNIILLIIQKLKDSAVSFTIHDVQYQLSYMVTKIKTGETIYNWVDYFVNGLNQRAENQQIAQVNEYNMMVSHLQSVVPTYSQGISKPVKLENWIEN